MVQKHADAVKKCTKAGTGCGGCVPMVKDLVIIHLHRRENMYAMCYANTLIIRDRNCLTL